MVTTQPMEKLFYNELFYKLISDTSYTSARIIAPLVIQLVNPQSAVDVGCGVAAWLAVFNELGVRDVFGIDGSYVKNKDLMIPHEQYMGCDLNEGSIPLDRQFDLALCLEVAQYLPREKSRLFIKALTKLAPVVLFSSAVPYQGGRLQINERWPHEWAELFREEGYLPVDCIREKIWNNKDVALWYAQNMILYVKESQLDALPRLKEVYQHSSGNQLSMIHPELWNTKMNYIYGDLENGSPRSKVKNLLRRLVFHDEYTS